jgi:hypothetical protein
MIIEPYILSAILAVCALLGGYVALELFLNRDKE